MLDMSAHDSSALARIKLANIQVAELTAEARLQIAVQMVEDALTTDDPELRRKIYDTLGKDSYAQEPKTPQVIVAPLNFQIVLDDTPQVAPPRRARAVPRAVEVEDAVVRPARLAHSTIDADEGVSLSDFVD